MIYFMLAKLRMKDISKKKLELNPPFWDWGFLANTESLLTGGIAKHTFDKRLEVLHLGETHEQQLLPKSNTNFQNIYDPVMTIRGRHCSYLQVLLVYFFLVLLQFVKGVTLVYAIQVAILWYHRFRTLLARFVIFLHQYYYLLVYVCYADVLLFLALAK